MADFLPFMPLYFEDFERGTREFDDSERMAYLRLLWFQWERGSVPDNVRSLAHIANVSPARFKAMWAERISTKFAPLEGAPGQLVNARQAAERAEASVRCEQKAAAGKASGAARKGRKGNGVHENGGVEANSRSTDVAENHPETGTAVERLFTKTGGKNEQPFTHDYMFTGSCDPKASLAGERADTREGGAGSVPLAIFNGAEFDALWQQVTRKATGGHPSLVEAARLVCEQAALQQPPADPRELAERLLRANVEMLADWRRRGEHHGAPKIVDFANPDHFAKVVDWLDGKRAPESSSRNQRPEPTRHHATENLLLDNARRSRSAT